MTLQSGDVAPPELHLPAFDGPLALLLELIEQRRMLVTEISLADVADQYLEAVRRLPNPAPDLLAEFLALASRLLLIKSRALLPRLVEQPAEQDEVVDLQTRLDEYRLVRAAAAHLLRLEQSQGGVLPGAPRDRAEPDHRLVAPSPEQLRHLARRALERAVAKGPGELAPSQPRTVVEVRSRLVLLLLREHKRILWPRVAGASRDEVAATFLAVLELFKRGRLRVEQESCFGPLWLTLPFDGVAVSLGDGAAGGQPE